jgi:hypothetical protein
MGTILHCYSVAVGRYPFILPICAGNDLPEVTIATLACTVAVAVARARARPLLPMRLGSQSIYIQCKYLRRHTYKDSSSLELEPAMRSARRSPEAKRMATSVPDEVPAAGASVVWVEPR